jgi:biopolymer transport protein ExbB/TolQ
MTLQQTQTSERPVPTKTSKKTWREGLGAVDEAQSIAILVVAATSIWAFVALRKRIDFLEHEVRWLRSELNDVKLIDSDRQRSSS